MNDLLSAGSSPVIPRGRSNRYNDIETGTHQIKRSGELGFVNFFEKVEEVDQQYEKLHTLLCKLQDAHKESKIVTRASHMKAIKHRMEKDIDEVGRVARFVKLKIEKIDRDNIVNRQKPGCGQGSGVDRSRVMTTVALKKKLKDRMSEFQILRENIQQEYREVVERRVFTVTGARPDEETIDKLIETGHSEQIYQRAIQEEGRGLLMDTLAEIQERHDAVRDLEKKLLALHQIFLDMAVLVEAQGDLLDNKESQVEIAVDHVQSSHTALKKAKNMQRSSRKWTCIAVLIFMFIAGGLLVSVVKPFRTKNGA